ncbi:MAG TPA: hypothetical protein VEH09_01695 [Thermodesulfobacteriota bacterium]|nr:hypothetical protein [Thermodesulfobacteriota bacterium]
MKTRCNRLAKKYPRLTSPCAANEIFSATLLSRMKKCLGEERSIHPGVEVVITRFVL